MSLAFATPALAKRPAPIKRPAKPVIVGEELPKGAGPRLDIVFVGGQHGLHGCGEIDTVKAEIRKMTKEILSGDPKPDVRFGAVKYLRQGRRLPASTRCPSPPGP